MFAAWYNKKISDTQAVNRFLWLFVSENRARTQWRTPQVAMDELEGLIGRQESPFLRSVGSYSLQLLLPRRRSVAESSIVQRNAGREQGECLAGGSRRSDENEGVELFAGGGSRMTPRVNHEFLPCSFATTMFDGCTGSSPETILTLVSQVFWNTRCIVTVWELCFRSLVSCMRRSCASPTCRFEVYCVLLFGPTKGSLAHGSVRPRASLLDCKMSLGMLRSLSHTVSSLPPRPRYSDDHHNG